MSDATSRLSLPYIQPAQAQKHVTHNEALARLDALVQTVVEAFDATTPPTNPTEGQIWALGNAPVQAWAGAAGQIAVSKNGGWLFVVPQTGWLAVDRYALDLRIWNGTAWVAHAAGDLNQIAGLGINTSYDAVNALAVAAPASLLTHGGTGGHQLKVNKAVASDTASLLFQTGFSGRAEMGTAGTDDFNIKVSADGTTWTTALNLDAATGSLQVPSGQTYFEDVFIVDDGVWSTDIPWSNPARILLWLGVNIQGYYFLTSVTGILTGAGNFGPMFANPAGKLNFATGILTGTTGSDGAITLSIDTSGAKPRLFVENRLGTNHLFTLATLGK